MKTEEGKMLGNGQDNVTRSRRRKLQKVKRIKGGGERREGRETKKKRDDRRITVNNSCCSTL